MKPKRGPVSTPKPRPGTGTPLPSHARRVRNVISLVGVAGLGTLLAWIFWTPLWNGGGLIGGDLYAYYFPQKVFLSESLKAGEIPFWNPLVGLGYPVLGESQTGALYPPNLIFYRLLDVNAAYNAGQLLHYVVAFVGMFLLTRRLGLALPGALLAATAFVYGWFPARICWEWAVVGGAWFTLILWAAAGVVQTGSRRDGALAALFLGLALLAGHYNLAFITLLAVLPLPWLVPTIPADASPLPSRRFAIPILGGSLALGFLIAGVQVIPTLELKSLSQRQEVNDVFSPTAGHLPPEAISQLWMPWAWYAGDSTFNSELEISRFLSVDAPTNQSEAQLYLGLAPFLLAIFGLAIPGWRRRLALRRPWLWGGLVIAGLLLASGWPTLLLQNLPGFGFFRGPGRYSLIAIFALATLGGAALDAAIAWRQWNRLAMAVATTLLLALTTGDLWAASRQYQWGAPPYVGRQVFYVTLLDDPPLQFLKESALRDFFQQAGPRARLYAPGANMATLLGVSSVPVYLGLAPELYESDLMQFDFMETNSEVVLQSAERLRDLGVTHLLLESPLNADVWPVTLLARPVDAVLNRTFARREPFFLYELQGSLGRVQLTSGDPRNQIRSMTVSPHRVRIELEQHSADQLVLKDLAYPGWKVEGDGLSEQADTGVFRVVDLPSPKNGSNIRTVEWRYAPASVRWGIAISVLGLLSTGVLAAWPRHSRPL